jgi:cobalamin biosynthesis Mg chelatase CobN
MADSDYSVSGSSGKGSSTTTTNELPSGSTSENENNDGNPSLCEENAQSFEPETVDTKTKGELNEQQKDVALTDTKNHEQLVTSKRDQQEAVISEETSLTDTNQSLVSKVGTEKRVSKLQDTEACENTAKSHDSSCNTKSEVCSSNSTSSVTIVERNCDDSEKKDELSSGESVQDRTSSSSVSCTTVLRWTSIIWFLALYLVELILECWVFLP